MVAPYPQHVQGLEWSGLPFQALAPGPLQTLGKCNLSRSPACKGLERSGSLGSEMVRGCPCDGPNTDPCRPRIWGLQWWVEGPALHPEGIFRVFQDLGICPIRVVVGYGVSEDVEGRMNWRAVSLTIHV